MQIRSFQLSDYSSVTRLLKEVLTETCYTETMAAFAKQLSWDSELVLVAQENNTIVGILIGTIDNNHGYYYRIAVLPPFQRRGIGRSLIRALKERFDRHKVRRVLVTLDSHNEPLIPLYESMGYRGNDFTRSIEKLSIANG
ncbi:GNAT family N-acetyltransferase [Ferviditalea candida]|uniref:GNAT family N-acetyltransferase n=1 Tax=Ferviditalea candida TaxID=3108399 RepID=A0ABU5ZIE5_9BACL|nr:GNAT family N-acetyltransferase [Paenibacillaceae bacterium T2]